MKKYIIIITYFILIAIIIYLFESILSGSFCHCQDVKCENHTELRSYLT